MKKFFICLVVMLGFATTDLFAQSEVRGVETKLVIYDGPEYKTWVSNGYRSIERIYTEWFGFSFQNMNSIPVSIDVELCYLDDYNNNRRRVVQRKSFVLNSQESYIWKFEDNTDFEVYYDGYEKTKPRRGSDSSYTYFVDYKAYKLE